MRMLKDSFLQTRTQSPISLTFFFFFWQSNQDLFYPLYLLEQSAVMLGHTRIIVLRLPESDGWLILRGRCNALNWIVRWRQSSGKKQTLQQDSKTRQSTTLWSDISIMILILQALFNSSSSNMIHSSIHDSFSRVLVNEIGAGKPVFTDFCNTYNLK